MRSPDPEEPACAAVLRGLSGTDSPKAAAAAVLRIVGTLHADASAVLLEGLARLARLHGADDALRALVVCAAASRSAWSAVVHARVPSEFPAFGNAVALALLAKECADSLFELSNSAVDFPTPVVAALAALFKPQPLQIDAPEAAGKRRAAPDSHDTLPVQPKKRRVLPDDAASPEKKGDPTPSETPREPKHDENAQDPRASAPPTKHEEETPAKPDPSDSEQVTECKKTEEARLPSERTELATTDALPSPPQEEHNTAKEQRAKLVHLVPAAAWLHVPCSLLRAIVDQLASDNALSSFANSAFTARLERAFAKPTPSTAILSITLQSHLGPLAQRLQSNNSAPFARLVAALRAPHPSHDAITTVEAAYAAALARNPASISLLASASRRWRTAGNLAPAAVAYTMHPRAVARASPIDAPLGRATQKLPRWVRGPVDDAVDSAVASLLARVPALTTLYTPRESARSAALALKRAALAEPWLVARRGEDLCAAIQVLVDALGEPCYKKATLDAMRHLVDAVRVPMAETRVRPEGALVAGRMVWRFLMGEERAHNGIPALFAELTVATLALLSTFGERVEVREMASLLSVLRDKDGTHDERIKMAVDAFLVKING